MTYCKLSISYLYWEMSVKTDYIYSRIPPNRSENILSFSISIRNLCKIWHLLSDVHLLECNKVGTWLFLNKTVRNRWPYITKYLASACICVIYVYICIWFVISGLGMFRKEVQEVIWTRFSRCEAKSNIAMGNVCNIATDWPSQKVNNMAYNFIKR